MRRRLADALPALLWIGFALIPYSFLTYSTQIPSRQVYLASFGLALLFGLAMVVSNPPRQIAAAILIVVMAANIGYLWTHKRRQYLSTGPPPPNSSSISREGVPGRSGSAAFPGSAGPPKNRSAWERTAIPRFWSGRRATRTPPNSARNDGEAEDLFYRVIKPTRSQPAPRARSITRTTAWYSSSRSARTNTCRDAPNR